MKAPGYFHAIGGRLRIEIPELKRSARNAETIESRLSKLGGVEWVKANPVTGNTLVLFDAGRIDHTRIVEHLKSCGFFQRPLPVSRRIPAAVIQQIVGSIIQLALESLVASVL